METCSRCRGIRVHDPVETLFTIAWNTQPSSPNPVPQIPPDVLRYLKGATAQSRQFDFLIGNWDVVATRFKDDGSVLFQYKAKWDAKCLNAGRMIIDDFKACGPSGEEVSSFVTLRTYSETTQRWEMQGLAALQPAAAMEWYGIWQDGEMLLDATGKNAEGKTIKTKIRFFEIKKDRFSWSSKTSRDEGISWVLSASLVAVRAPTQSV
jgi:hypothetical protein